MRYVGYALIYLTLALTSIAFAEDGNIKAAEQVARRVLELNISGDYASAVKLIDEQSLKQATAIIISAWQESKDRGRLNNLEQQLGTTLSFEELKRLSPQDFYVRVIGGKLQQAVQQAPEKDRASIRNAKVSVVESKLLSNDTAQVVLLTTASLLPEPVRNNTILRRNGTEWKVIVRVPVP